MEMPKPTDHHEKMRKHVGRWEGVETMHPSEWDPKGGTATGRTDARIALGGFAVIGDYEQERDGAITYAGHSVLTYDTKERCYVLHWFDSMGSPPEVFRGHYTGDTLTVSHGGSGMHARLTYRFMSAGQMTARMEMSPDGKDWNVLFDAAYRRV